MISPPLTPNAITYAWQRLWAIAGAEEMDIPRHYGPVHTKLPRPGVIVVPTPAEAWPELLELPPHSLKWLPASALFPPDYPLPFADDLPVLFWGEERGDKPPVWVREDGSVVFQIDILAATLFMLTRWEEVALPDRDQHDRFPATAAAAYRQGFLDQPIVDRYAMILRAWLQKLRPSWQPPPRKLRLRLSHDIDHQQRFQTLNLALRQTGRDLVQAQNPALAWQDVWDFTRARLHFATNPYLTAIDLLAKQAEALNTQAVFYILVGGKTIYDTGYDVNIPAFHQRLIHLHERGHIIGLHPSYETYLDPDRYQQEKEHLEKALGLPVRHARQHYLRFRIPHTWRVAAQAGIQEDATLSYAQSEGFRCGTSYPFPVFDILEDRTLPLTELPLHVMDGSLREYQHLSPQDSLHRLRLMARRVAEVGGVLHLLWHNHAIARAWAPWYKIYSQFLSELTL